MASRSSLSFWVFLVILILLHFILHVALGFAAGAPDLLTVVLLLAARRLSGSIAAAFGLVLGVIADALSLTSFGALAVVYTIVGFAGARSRDLFEGESLLFIGAYIFVGKWLRDVLYLVLTHSASREPWGSL